jgi:hypothetical protein
MTTSEFLLNKYGARMSVADILAELKIPYDTFMQKRSRGTLGVHTYRDGMRVFAATVDVADHLDRLAQPA